METEMIDDIDVSIYMHAYVFVNIQTYIRQRLSIGTGSLNYGNRSLMIYKLES